MDDRAELPTERTNPRSEDLDLLTTAEAFDVFDAEDRRCAEAVAGARAEVIAAIDLVAERLARGGRLLYVGAGTSGRLGVLDAVECPPTFQSDPEQVQGRLAGGAGALLRSVEGAEDSADGGRAAVEDARPEDVVFGIAAGGTTPFVHGAIAEARARGAATVFLACVSRTEVPDEADVSIRLDTGPEVLAGSTRLKAGTATKLVLNRVTTIAMARLGKIHGNRMVDVNTAANQKLTARGVVLVRDLVECDEEQARTLLEAGGGSVKVATVMGWFACDRAAAEARLDRAGGFLRRALRDAPR